MANKANQSMLWWLLGLGGLVMAWTLRKPIGRGVMAALDAAKVGIFKTIIPLRTLPYADAILQASAEEGVNAYLVVALMERESLSGTAPGYYPTGPSGTGDYGHGHGLMQIDDRSWGQWLQSNAWFDPYTNIKKGIQILKGKMQFFRQSSAMPVKLSAAEAAKRNVRPGEYPDPRPLLGDSLIVAALAAYNTGEGNVLKSIASGVHPAATTSGQNYSIAVLSKLGSLLQAAANA